MSAKNIGIRRNGGRRCLPGPLKMTIWTLLKYAVLYQVRVSNWDNVARQESRIFYHSGRIYGFNLTSVFTFYLLD